MITSAWCLELILVAFTKAAPFEPVATCSHKHLTLKTPCSLLPPPAGPLHTLICKAPYFTFSNSGVMLFTRLSFLLKVATKENASHPILMPAIHNEKDRALRRLCVKCALNEYLQRTSEEPVVSGSRALASSLLPMMDKPISKQRLSKWLVKCIKFSYDKHVLPTPEGAKVHQAHKMAVTYMYWYADMVDPQTICTAMTWSNNCMFAKFFRLDAIANSDAEFGRRVLMPAGFSIPAPHHLGRYHILQKSHFCW